MHTHRVVSNQSENPYGFEIFVHSPQDVPKATIVNIPGYQSDINGYNNKYVTLGQDLARRGFEFVQMPNIARPLGRQYAAGLLGDLRAVIEFFSRDVGGRAEPIYLMGFSAGGFAAAAMASESPDIAKVLLMEPSASKSLLGEFPRSRLSRFKGEVYIVIGDHESVGLPVGELYRDAFSSASRKELIIIPDCDHQFKGTINGQRMAKAPLWAFDGDTTFPSPEGGLVLY